MKARERAGAVWDQFALDLAMPNGNRPPVTVQRIILAIEQAIIAAEEEKAKVERERWKQLFVEEISKLRNIAQYCKETRDTAGAARWSDLAAVIERLSEIRARS